MRTSQVVAGLGMAALGAVIALLVRPGQIKPFQVTGDPPVTVSDGSLHAHSSGGWVADQDGDKTIQPSPSTGTLAAGCGVHDLKGNSIAASSTGRRCIRASSRCG